MTNPHSTNTEPISAEQTKELLSSVFSSVVVHIHTLVMLN